MRTRLPSENLEVAYRVRGRDLNVLRDLSFRIGSGEAYGLVGESGCGKSTVALAVVRYLPRNGRLLGGRILIGERDLYALRDEEMRRLRATTIQWSIRSGPCPESIHSSGRAESPKSSDYDA